MSDLSTPADTAAQCEAGDVPQPEPDSNEMETASNVDQLLQMIAQEMQDESTETESLSMDSNYQSLVPYVPDYMPCSFYDSNPEHAGDEKTTALLDEIDIVLASTNQTIHDFEIEHLDPVASHEAHLEDLFKLPENDSSQTQTKRLKRPGNPNCRVLTSSSAVEEKRKKALEEKEKAARKTQDKQTKPRTRRSNKKDKKGAQNSPSGVQKKKANEENKKAAKKTQDESKQNKPRTRSSNKKDKNKDSQKGQGNTKQTQDKNQKQKR